MGADLVIDLFLLLTLALAGNVRHMVECKSWCQAYLELTPQQPACS